MTAAAEASAFEPTPEQPHPRHRRLRVSVSARSPVVQAGIETLLRESGFIEIARHDAEVQVTETAPASAHGAPAVWLSDEGTLRDGVRAVLPREASEQEIVAAVEAVAAGLIAVHPQFLETLQARPVMELAEPLTPRESEVLRLLAEGVANKEIAWRLSISEHTVKFHVASVLDKLNASSRTEAVAKGIRSGLVVV